MSKRDDLSALTAKVYMEVKEHIRSLSLQPVHSSEWKVVANRVIRLSAIVESERALGEAAEKAGKAPGTLWDAKGEEWTLRHLLEQGKLNLLLRLADTYLQHEQTASQAAVRAAAAGDLTKSLAALSLATAPAAAAGADGAETNSEGVDPVLCSKFESAIGSLVTTAWHHREALQTSDLPLVASILQRSMALALSPAAAALRPGIAMLPSRLLARLGTSLAAVGEEKLVPELGRYGIFALLPTHAVAIAAAGMGMGSAAAAGVASPPTLSTGSSPASPAPDAPAPLLVQGLVGGACLMAGEEFAMIKANSLLKGAGKDIGVPGADAVIAAVLDSPSVGAQAASIAVTACTTPGQAAVTLPAGVHSHAAACADLAKGQTATVVGLSDMALKRKLRTLLDYTDAVARAVKR